MPFNRPVQYRAVADAHLRTFPASMASGPIRQPESSRSPRLEHPQCFQTTTRGPFKFFYARDLNTANMFRSAVQFQFVAQSAI